MGGEARFCGRCGRALSSPLRWYAAIPLAIAVALVITLVFLMGAAGLSDDAQVTPYLAAWVAATIAGAGGVLWLTWLRPRSRR